MRFPFFRRSRSAPVCRRPAASARPRLEVLEDRLVPSGLPGTLDTAFNSTGSPPGIVTTSIPGNGVGITPPHDAIDPSGRIVVTANTVTHKQFFVARYNANGSLDTSQGSNALG